MVEHTHTGVPQISTLTDVRDPRAARVAPHVTRLPGGPWTVWRDVVLRGAGFPAALVSDLAGEREAAAADRYNAAVEEARQRAAALMTHLGAAPKTDASARRRMKALRRSIRDGRVLADGCREAFNRFQLATAAHDAAWAELARACEADTAIVEGRIRAIVSDPRFREALLWQNRESLAVITRRVRDRLGSAGERRIAAQYVALHVQRYAVKNDTIGFFGPVGWASFADLPEIAVVQPGAELVADRRVYFEGWCVDALVERLNEEPGVGAWTCPRLRTGIWRGPDGLYAPMIGPLPLTPAERGLLMRCDGRHTASAIVAAVLADPSCGIASEADALALLHALVRKRLVIWRLEVASQLHPDRALLAQLARIEDDDLRARCERPVIELRAARDRVAAAAGDPDALDGRLRELEATFTRLTGRPPTRRPGETYAARTLVYEDCRRNCDLVLGRAFLERIGPPLSMLLDAARWAVTELAAGGRRQLRLRYAQLRGASREPIDGDRFLRYLRASRQQAVDALCLEIARRYQRVWQDILRVDHGGRRCHYRFAEIAGAARAAFATHGPGWSRVRYICPDLMIAADGLDALRRGEFHAVLGEMHGVNTLTASALLAQHPNPHDILRAAAHDTRHDAVVVLQTPKADWIARTEDLVLPTFWRYEFAEDLPSAPACRSLPAAMLLAVDNGETVKMVARDGSVAFDALELFGVPHEMINRRLPEAPHTPRVTIDELTIARETWHVTPADMDFLGEENRYRRFAAVRRWAQQHGMPRRVFYKSPAERKPCLLDFDSRIYVDVFAKSMKRVSNDAVRIVEMLPDVHEAWLPDAAGARHTCELRIAASYDPANGGWVSG